MNMEDETIKITFEIKSTDDINISNFNTLVLQLNNFYQMITHIKDSIKEIKPYNIQIDHIINTLENMKYTIIDDNTSTINYRSFKNAVDNR